MVKIVAEVSANHNQKYTDAELLVRASKQAGADAVKLQTYTPDTLTIKSDRPEFRIKGGLWDGKTLYELYSEAFMPWEWQPKLKKLAEELGLELFSTPFDKKSVDFLETIGVARYKIASFEIVDLPLISYVASKGKPIILSTGMATFDEIKDAVIVVRRSGVNDITLLKCTSAYPAIPEEMNLGAIPFLSKYFGLPVGLSDHTLGITAPIVATTLGACMIEKHITLSRNSVDSGFSLLPHEFRYMVDSVRQAEKMLGDKIVVAEQEQASRIFRRSLFAVEDIKAGETFTEQNVRSIRPCNGLLPKYLKGVLGLNASRDIQRGTPLEWELLS